MSNNVIVNKVAESGIVTINLEDFYPKQEIVVFDMKNYLFREMILKEKDFRETLKTTDWQQYRHKTIALTNTADAIIPMWAYMLVASYLEPYADSVVFGNEKQLVEHMMVQQINAIGEKEYEGKRIVIKGCGDIDIPEGAYIAITLKLRPVVKSLMYGEPCSTVPVYKTPVALTRK
ncbi:MAG: DUF2480 family protein [Chitinophagaceae bacterium]|nr:DUF2480 family protein [Chitinophagaceae bacterium]